MRQRRVCAKQEAIYISFLSTEDTSRLGKARNYLRRNTYFSQRRPTGIGILGRCKICAIWMCDTISADAHPWDVKTRRAVTIRCREAGRMSTASTMLRFTITEPAKWLDMFARDCPCRLSCIVFRETNLSEVVV